MNPPGAYVPAVLIGVSLAMDALAVSVGSGISIPGLRTFHILRASFFFGLFQFLMPAAGWFLGNSLASRIGAFDHWVVFCILSVIGGKMALESLKSGKKGPANESADTELPDNRPRGGAGASPPQGSPKTTGKPQRKEAADIRNIWALLSVSLATSIDALAVGVSFSLLNQGIWINALIIGAVTFCCCLAGFEFGRRLGGIFERWAGLAGGLMLIGVGLKILLEHLIQGA
ncbi:MAG: manganese efflux pump MntP family protein [Treponema sp.]|nr:manganese efflux pump MntP family protein [Treponema sp.]